MLSTFKVFSKLFFATLVLAALIFLIAFPSEIRRSYDLSDDYTLPNNEAGSWDIIIPETSKLSSVSFDLVDPFTYESITSQIASLRKILKGRSLELAGGVENKFGTFLLFHGLDKKNIVRATYLVDSDGWFGVPKPNGDLEKIIKFSPFVSYMAPNALIKLLSNPIPAQTLTVRKQLYSGKPSLHILRNQSSSENCSAFMYCYHVGVYYSVAKNALAQTKKVQAIKRSRRSVYVRTKVKGSFLNLESVSAETQQNFFELAAAKKAKPKPKPKPKPEAKPKPKPEAKPKAKPGKKPKHVVQPKKPAIWLDPNDFPEEGDPCDLRPFVQQLYELPNKKGKVDTDQWVDSLVKNCCDQLDSLSDQQINFPLDIIGKSIPDSESDSTIGDSINKTLEEVRNRCAKLTPSASPSSSASATSTETPTPTPRPSSSVPPYPSLFPPLGY